MSLRSRFITVVTAVTISAYTVSAAAIYSLYTDHRAMRNDDILTILIVENSKAGTKSTTSTGKGNSFGISGAKGTGALDFIPSVGGSGELNTGFNGKGATSREGNFIATISARVIDVLDNGNLVIDGSKVVEINENKEIIKISGIVRPEDVGTNNTIYSYNVSDAKITYSGKGVTDMGRRPGLLARFFNFIF